MLKEDAEASSPQNHSLKSVLTKKNILGQIKKERNYTSKEPQDLTTVWQEEPVEYIWILDPEGCLSGVPEHKVGYKKIINVSSPGIQDITLCQRDSANILLGRLLEAWKIQWPILSKWKYA